MRFTLQNLGRLEEATIDLSKDLIVLTGPNNTSKTYVAHAIYGFCKQIDEALAGPIWGQFVPLGDPVEFDMVELVVHNLDTILTEMSRRYVRSLSDVFATDESFAVGANLVVGFDAEEIAAAKQRIIDSDIHWQLAGFGPHQGIAIDKSRGSQLWACSLVDADANGTDKQPRVRHFARASYG